MMTNWTQWFSRRTERAAAPEPPPPPPRPSIRAARTGRPMSQAMQAAVDLVRRNPAVSPAEVAGTLSISRTYARTVLKRAREHAAAPVVPEPSPAHAVVPFLPAGVPLNLNRRSQVLHMLGRGESQSDVAQKLAVPVGEVAFVAKIDRLLAARL